jgi:hypothetical protein
MAIREAYLSAPSSHGNTVRAEKASVYVGDVSYNKKERLATLPDREKKRRSMPDYERTVQGGTNR